MSEEYKCPGCRNGDHESHFIGYGKCACIPCIKKEFETLKQALANAEKALAFYANEENYSEGRGFVGTFETYIEMDGGKFAKESLAELRRVLNPKSEER